MTRELHKEPSALRFSVLEKGTVEGFCDELSKIANLTGGLPTSVSDVNSTIPKNTLKPGAAKYTKINTEAVGSPVQQAQPVLNPPPVRG